MDAAPGETKRLKNNVEWALRRALDPATVLPMLHRLSRLSAAGSDENLYAQRRLAELLLDQDPWRAALAARRVLAALPSDDGAWAILAACHALLGHYRCAVAAYRRALALAPDNAAYAHNLGHLLDVALDRPREALPLLSVAYDASGRQPEVAVSFAHALARGGDLERARDVCRRALPGEGLERSEHAALTRWLAAGATTEAKLLSPHVARRARYSWMSDAPPPRKKQGARGPSRLEGVLVKGLACLPLDARQRARARELLHHLPADVAHADDAAVVAAVAYAVVFVEGVPLSQADVAACFRVRVPALRGQFKALRACFELEPADRHATRRPR